MKTTLMIVAFLVIVLLIVHYQKVDTTLQIISVNSALSEQKLNFVLYVPGGKSTCQWEWDENGARQNFTTIGDGQNAEHDFMYPKDKTNFSNPAVKCLSDNGKTYTGLFPKN